MSTYLDIAAPIYNSNANSVIKNANAYPLTAEETAYLKGFQMLNDNLFSIIQKGGQNNLLGIDNTNQYTAAFYFETLLNHILLFNKELNKEYNYVNYNLGCYSITNVNTIIDKFNLSKIKDNFIKNYKYLPILNKLFDIFIYNLVNINGVNNLFIINGDNSPREKKKCKCKTPTYSPECINMFYNTPSYVFDTNNSFGCVTKCNCNCNKQVSNNCVLTDTGLQIFNCNNFQMGQAKFYFPLNLDLTAMTDNQISNYLNNLSSNNYILGNDKSYRVTVALSQQFMYFAYNANFNTNTQTDFKINGFTVNAFTTKSFNFTNALGVTTAYTLVKSNNYYYNSLNFEVNG
jgi:hypothetical protein